MDLWNWAYVFMTELCITFLMSPVPFQIHPKHRMLKETGFMN